MIRLKASFGLGDIRWSIFWAAFALGLCGCAGMDQTVKVPVSESCLVEVTPGPAYPDTKDAIIGADDIAVRVNLLLAGRILRDKRIDELMAQLSGCK